MQGPSELLHGLERALLDGILRDAQHFANLRIAHTPIAIQHDDFALRQRQRANRFGHDETDVGALTPRTLGALHTNLLVEYALLAIGCRP